MEPNGYFVRLFKKVSTTDNTPYLCVSAAPKFREDVCGGKEQIRRYCKWIAAEGGRRLAEILGTDVLGSLSADDSWSCSFTNIRLPLDLRELEGARGDDGRRIAKWIQEKTPQEYETYIPTKFYQGQFWSRISGQIYLTVDDFEAAGKILLELSATSDEDREAASNPEHAQRWIKMSALYDHMHALNGGMLSTYCTWTMRDGFESAPPTHYAAPDCHVSATARWILYSGQTIPRAISVSPEDDDSLLRGREPRTLDAWRRWKAGFTAAENEESLQHWTGQLAKNSATLMGRSRLPW
ncbi:hypothetical protein DL766_006567 [Monosporascus sp. MC13-8B]|nr:hypothetical protein DL766_006567 [Monosporascus sp. MC13-8B]